MMNEYDVDVWTDYKQFYLIVSADTEGQAISLSLDYLIFNNLVKREEHLTRTLAKQIKRLSVPAIQWMRGTYQSSVTKVNGG